MFISGTSKKSAAGHTSTPAHHQSSLNVLSRPLPIGWGFDMAGDWIKMRGNLWDDPRVARLADLTDNSEAAVVGGLYWLWATADQHSADGIMPGLSLKGIDRKTGIPGFGKALCQIGWLVDHPEGVRIPHFEEHNGDSAKKRCQTAKRVAKSKQGNADQQENSDQTSTTGNAQVTLSALPNEQASVSTALPREREEKSINTPIPPSGAKTGQSAISLPTWLTTIKAMGEDPIPADDPVFGYADSVGIPRDHLRLAWREFRERYSLPNAKRYRCWRTVFRKAVRGNWFKLWHFAGDACALTTTGVQAKRAAEATSGVMA